VSEESKKFIWVTLKWYQITEFSKSWFIWHQMMQDALLTLLCTNGTLLLK